MDFSGLFGAAGSIFGSLVQSSAMKDATRMQVDALNQARNFVYENLDPSVVNTQAKSADIANIWARLGLQAQTDPALLASRYTAEGGLQKGLEELGKQPGQVSDQAVKEALAGIPQENEAKAALMASAMKQLGLGATLPPDVQSELAQAGLEQSGMVTGASSGKGVGGQLLRTILGSAGLKLQQQRETAAMALMNQANQLQTSRQNILQSLFPRLSEVQLANIKANQGALATSDAMMPQSGLTGSQVANLWLARVGATNTLAQDAASVAAKNAMGQGATWAAGLSGALGGVGKTVSSALTSSPTLSADQQRADNAALGIGAI